MLGARTARRSIAALAIHVADQGGRMKPRSSEIAPMTITSSPASCWQACHNRVRVVDATILPEIPSVATNVTTIWPSATRQNCPLKRAPPSYALSDGEGRNHHADLGVERNEHRTHRCPPACCPAILGGGASRTWRRSLGMGEPYLDARERNRLYGFAGNCDGGPVADRAGRYQLVW